jgi:hypothetical protein
MNINNKTPGRVISKSWNLPNFSVKVLTLTLAFIVGLLLGPIISDENVQASGSCDSTTCELDYSGGWRCFYTGWNRTCNDSAYPSCSDFLCDQPQHN